ncbi:MAG: cytochrome-c oxidase [Gammaproteobacteria bacterium]|nr:cytochrome-c oxidase [Gammaproteobacteria bacterium]
MIGKFFKQLTDKPWLPPEQEVVAEINTGAVALAVPPARVALRLFLCVAFVLFSLFSVAYYVRMELDDWRPLAEPGLLWLNTAVILLSSVALQIARQAVQRGNTRTVSFTLTLGGLLTIAFLVGQYMTWGELRGAGYFAAGNPANAFYYLLTAVHGLHLLGGLVVWARTVKRMWQGAEPYQIRLSIELCTTYWHFLALVWLGILWILIST